METILAHAQQIVYTLAKCGKFKPFEHLISVYKGKRGLHLVVLYLVIGCWRVPGEFSGLER
jgi:hypothetical protein